MFFIEIGLHSIVAMRYSGEVVPLDYDFTSFTASSISSLTLSLSLSTSFSRNLSTPPLLAANTRIVTRKPGEEPSSRVRVTPTLDNRALLTTGLYRRQNFTSNKNNTDSKKNTTMEIIVGKNLYSFE